MALYRSGILETVSGCTALNNSYAKRKNESLDGMKSREKGREKKDKEKYTVEHIFLVSRNTTLTAMHAAHIPLIEIRQASQACRIPFGATGGS